jgi:hypothetical protein
MVVTLDNGACVVHSAPTQRLTFAEILLLRRLAEVYQEIQSRKGRTP